MRFIPSFGNDLRRAELPGKLLPRRVAAHRNDALRPHLLRREDAEEPHSSIADDDRRRRTGLHVRRVGSEPAGAHDV